MVELRLVKGHLSSASLTNRHCLTTIATQMPKMMLSADRLSDLLKPHGFWCWESDCVTKTIGFVRSSTVPRLYEHLIVEGQGKAGEAVYAKTAISGSTTQARDECVAEVDLTLLYALETDKDRHWTLLRNKQEAQIWETRLARVADSQCRATAQTKGPAMHERLKPVFAAVDRYIAKLGNLNDIFESESNFFQAAPAEQRSEADRLASLIGNIGESSDDVELACLVLFLHAPQVEDQPSAFRGKKWYEDPNLRARIYLMVDFIREQRNRYLRTTQVQEGSQPPEGKHPSRERRN